MLPKNRRLTREDFKNFQQPAKTVNGRFLSLRTSASSDLTKFAVVVPNSVAKRSVDRHLVKRRCMEVLRKVVLQNHSGFYCVFYAKATALAAAFKDLENEIIVLLKHAGVLK